MQKLFFFSISTLLFTALGCQHTPAPKAQAFTDTALIKFDDETPTYLEMNKRMPTALSVYKLTGRCGGLPRVNVKTAPGFCVGQIDGGDGLSMPRTAVSLPSGNLLMVDMGSWEPNGGKIYFYKKEANGTYTRSLYMDAKTIRDPAKKKIIDRPHQIILGQDGMIYVGASGSIGKFDPSAKVPSDTVQIVVDNISNQGLHPLKAFAFDDQNNIYVNVGSATNVCEKRGDLGERLKQCPEAEDPTQGQAQIRKYYFERSGIYNPRFEIYAKGLRNSMALMWDQKKGHLVQMENSRDAIDKNAPQINTKLFPHEEMNIITPGNHYGWPYCYDNNANNPEWKSIDCSKYAKPYMLMPPHASPLGVLLYSGTMFPAWYQNRTIVSLHGYEALGHRIVTYLRNDEGLPTGAPLSIVYGWDTDGAQRMGSPVGISQMPDGSLLIVEDKSRKVLRLFYDPTQGNGAPVKELEPGDGKDVNEAVERERKKEALEERLRDPNPPLFSVIQRRLIDKHCASCHTGEDARGLELSWYDDIGNEARIKKEHKGIDVYRRISGDTTLGQMPPDGFDPDPIKNAQEQKELSELFKRWLETEGR